MVRAGRNWGKNYWRAALVWLLVLVCGGVVWGCASDRVDPGYLALVDQQHDLPSTGELGVGDQFHLRVYGEAELSGDFTVAADGTVNYPHVGRFRAAGMTCAEVEDYLTEGLKKGFLRNPSLNCSITEYRSKQIFIFGEVEAPGSFPYRTDISIIEAFALAGGFSDRANTNNTKLTRVVDGVEIQVRIPMQEIVEGRQRNLRLLPGDVIFVPATAY
jgi:protein involved in polysaccharide export with SLBB domain